MFFFGIDYTFNKKFIIIKFRGKVYKAFLSIKNDLYNRSTLTWYQDLGDEFSKYKLENLAVCFRKLSNEEYLLDILSDIDDDYIVNDNVIVEGDYHIIESIRYERNAKNRKNAILIHGLYCQACGFNFESKYGILGKNYIEVHHLIPLSIGSKERIVNPETDLVCLCSNCHRMIHRIKNVDYNKALIELKRVIGENEFKLNWGLSSRQSKF